jgi:hypothetical protein
MKNREAEYYLQDSAIKSWVWDCEMGGSRPNIRKKFNGVIKYGNIPKKKELN